MRDGPESPDVCFGIGYYLERPAASREDCARYSFSMKTGQMIPIRK